MKKEKRRHITARVLLWCHVCIYIWFSDFKPLRCTKRSGFAWDGHHVLVMRFLPECGENNKNNYSNTCLKYVRTAQEFSTVVRLYDSCVVLSSEYIAGANQRKRRSEIISNSHFTFVQYHLLLKQQRTKRHLYRTEELAISILKLES